MDWSNERYVRLYCNDTKSWKLLGWEGQAVFTLLLRKVDRSGILDDVYDAEDVALMLGYGFPVDVAERGLSRLIKRGTVEITDKGLLIPNYIEAQETSKSDAQRKRESRERKRALARTDTTPSQARAFVNNAILNEDLFRESCQLCGSTRHVEGHHPDYSNPLEVIWLCRSCHKKLHCVTKRDIESTKRDEASRASPMVSQPVTLTSADPVLTNADPVLSVESARARASKTKERKRAIQIPTKWEPNEKHYGLAKGLGIDADREAEKFRDHALSKGRVAKDWNAAFRNWLRKAAEFTTIRPARPTGTYEKKEQYQRGLDHIRQRMEEINAEERGNHRQRDDSDDSGIVVRSISGKIPDGQEWGDGD